MFGGTLPLSARGFAGDFSVSTSELPTDGISNIALSDTGTSSLLAASSWDSTVRLWSVASNYLGGFGEPVKAAGVVKDSRPVLSTCFRNSDNALLLGGLSNEVKLWQEASGTESAGLVVARHGKPVKAVRWLEHHGGLVVSGSWDGTVRFSDPRTPIGGAPACTLDLQAKVLAMDVRGETLVVATTDRAVKAFDVGPGSGLATGQPRLIDSSSGSLEQQYRSVALFSDCSGYAVGSIEGRTTIKYFKEEGSAKTFTFKCHRKTPPPPPGGSKVIEAYPVNGIAFHPLGTFATCGGDGTFCFWDYRAKSRLKNFEGLSEEGVSSCAFNPRGDVFAYSLSDDWFKGPPKQNGTPAAHGIFLHKVKDAEIKPKR